MIESRASGGVGFRASAAVARRQAAVVAGRAAEGARAVGRCTVLAGFVALTVLVAGCSLDGLLNSDELPEDISDPAIIETPEGALAAYHGVIEQLRYAFGGGPSMPGVVGLGGLLGDELQAASTGAFSYAGVDQRHLPEEDEDVRGVAEVYGALQRVRGQAAQAIGLLTRHAPQHRAFAGHAYALQAYAEVFLAELYCSGVPLSTLDFGGDFTYRPGSSTGEVLEHALAAFDTALALTADHAVFTDLARVGKARALAGLGRFEEAAAMAAAVPDAFRYELRHRTDWRSMFSFVTAQDWPYTVADRQGLNGLDYRSGGDPRTATTLVGTSARGTAIYFPDRYATDGSSPIVMASGIEARLIEAEAALRGNGDWLGILNALRTGGTLTTRPNPDDPARTDTLWNAGIGGVPGLAPLEDPVAAAARVDMLFRERAFWLFLTGHRQGDLRRLIRYYGRTQDQVYPVGLYPGVPGASFGSHVDAPVPLAERVSNPHFTGCAMRGA